MCVLLLVYTKVGGLGRVEGIGLNYVKSVKDTIGPPFNDVPDVPD